MQRKKEFREIKWLGLVVYIHSRKFLKIIILLLPSVFYNAVGWYL